MSQKLKLTLNLKKNISKFEMYMKNGSKISKYDKMGKPTVCCSAWPNNDTRVKNTVVQSYEPTVPKSFWDDRIQEHGPDFWISYSPLKRLMFADILTVWFKDPNFNEDFFQTAVSFSGFSPEDFPTFAIFVKGTKFLVSPLLPLDPQCGTLHFRPTQYLHR